MLIPILATMVYKLIATCSKMQTKYNKSSRTGIPSHPKSAGNPGGQPAIERGTASGGAVLGEVRSQPVSQLIQPMLRESDNSLAETFGRLLSHHYGLGGTAASLTDAFTRALASYGVPTGGLVIRDASGLSFANEIPPSYLAQLFAVIERTPSMAQITAAVEANGMFASPYMP